jgi:hypothetical protein
MRSVINALAVIGAISLLGVIGSLIPRSSYEGATGVVMGPEEKPAASIPVFLDRGDGIIERLLTDSLGRFTLPIDYARLERAAWLICVPGGIPYVGHRRRDLIGPTTYGYTPLPDTTEMNLRSFGWRGPIPRECPPSDSSYRWRYPPEAGKNPAAATRTEPDWARYKRSP